MKISKFRMLALAAAAGVSALSSGASAQLFLNAPTFQGGAIEANDPLVGLALPDATPAEYRAHLIWNLRSGLNVAALQCQFSPTLRTVANYNAFLAHHSSELASAYSALEGYFRRRSGPRNGPREFDQYSTQTYNNFSTLQAQLGFCQTAAGIGRDALLTRKGQLGQLATARMRELRSSLTAYYDPIVPYNPATVVLADIRAISPNCAALSRRERRRCERGE